METRKIAVRELVEFILRGGDIGGAGTALNVERAWEGSRLHRKLQKEAGPGYEREVLLSAEVPLSETMLLCVEGRADGIYLANAPREEEDLQQSLLDDDHRSGVLAGAGAEQVSPIWTVDEIKSVSMELSALKENLFPLHWAQAECYAYMLARDKELSRVQIRLSYVSTETEEVRCFYRVHSLDELAEFWDGLIRGYSRFALWEEDWKAARDRSAEALAFPFPEFRPGQEEMCETVSDAIRTKQRVFLEAPTGIGKTMSALFPAVKSLGRGEAEKVFYLTAKTVTAQAPLAALALLCEGGLRVKTVVIYAKDKICPLEKRKCSAAACPYARGHFDRVNEALFEALAGPDLIDRARIEELSRKYSVCPFELSLDISNFADLVICDYNYAFDPTVALKRFFRAKNNYVLLVDEAHNLVERGREMFSATLSRRDFAAVKRLFPSPALAPALHRALNRVLRLFDELAAAQQNEFELYERGADPGEEWYFTLDRFDAAAGAYMEEFKDSPRGVPEELVNLFFATLFFLRVWDNPRGPYEFYVHKTEGNVELRFFCIDPAPLLRETYQLVRSTVFFSATLSPASYYLTLLDGPEAGIVQLPSPFDASREKVLIAPLAVSYSQRGNTLATVCALISQVYRAKPGHYLVFFPSFAYLLQVLELFRAKYRDIPVLAQSGGMDDAARAAYLAAFERPDPFLGFAVLGGLFAEGIDLAGDRLIGAVVVTVGLPQIGPERDLIQKHMEESRGEGFEYAYVYPGWGRVLQAAGRVIRTEQDRGVVLLIDRRFSGEGYRELFPEHWNPREITDESLPGELRRFWDEYK